MKTAALTLGLVGGLFGFAFALLSFFAGGAPELSLSLPWNRGSAAIDFSFISPPLLFVLTMTGSVLGLSGTALSFNHGKAAGILMLSGALLDFNLLLLLGGLFALLSVSARLNPPRLYMAYPPPWAYAYEKQFRKARNLKAASAVLGITCGAIALTSALVYLLAVYGVLHLPDIGTDLSAGFIALFGAALSITGGVLAVRYGTPAGVLLILGGFLCGINLFIILAGILALGPSDFKPYYTAPYPPQPPYPPQYTPFPQFPPQYSAAPPQQNKEN